MSNPEQINSYGTVYDTYTKQGKAKPSTKPKTPSKEINEAKPSAKPKTPSKEINEAKPSAKPKTPSKEINEAKPSAKPKTPSKEINEAKPKTPSKEAKPSAKVKIPREETKPKLHEIEDIDPVKFPRKRRVVLEGTPKKPLNSYQLFVQIESKRDIYMGLPPRERMSKVAAVWREISRVEI